MKSLKINASDAASIHKTFINYCSATTETFDFGKKIILNESQGSGELYFFEFNKGMSMMIYDCTFYEGLNLEIDTGKANLIYFFYPLSKNINMARLSRPLENFQTMILSTGEEDVMQFSFPQNKATKLVLFKIDKHNYTKKRKKLLNNRQVLHTIFNDSISEVPALHVCSPNLLISHLIHNLSLHALKQTHGVFVLEAEANLILAHMLSQYVLDQKRDGNQWVLTKEEQERIRHLVNKIMANPGEPYSIEQITSETGLNPYKLQEGFKKLYKHTVADFIRDKRLIRAAELLATNEYNVTQVVERIGLSSNSYFTKIFKNKYNCCPKDYQKKLKNYKSPDFIRVYK